MPHESLHAASMLAAQVPKCVRKRTHSKEATKIMWQRIRVREENAKMGSQHPSPDVKTLCNFEPQIWPESITSRDAKSTCFKGSRTSCDVIILAFWGKFLAGKDHIT